MKKDDTQKILDPLDPSKHVSLDSEESAEIHADNYDIDSRPSEMKHLSEEQVADDNGSESMDSDEEVSLESMALEEENEENADIMNPGEE